MKRARRRDTGRINRDEEHYQRQQTASGCAVVKPTAPVQTASPPTLVPLGTNQSDIAFRLQIADQIWRYIAHGLVITDAAGILQCANPAFINMLRYSAEQEVIGLDIRSATDAHRSG